MPGLADAHGGAAVAPGALRPALDAATGSPRGCSSARALGFVYTPVREPDPGGGDLGQRRVRANRRDRDRLRVGSALVLLALTLGGRRLFDRVRRAGRGPRCSARSGRSWSSRRSRSSTNLDVNFDQFVAQHIPERQPHGVARVLRTPSTSRLHRDHRPRQGRRSTVRGVLDSPTSARRVEREPGEAARRRARGCETSAPRPNSPKRRTGSTRPATDRCSLTSLRGRVVLVDFWTYTCINCIRTLPYLKAWDAAYRQRRPDDRRRRDARVRLRARRRQRRQRDRPVRPALPGRPGQQHGHLERVRQPVLARRLPDRRHGPGALRRLRRGRLRQDRNRDPRAAGRIRRAGRRA